MILDRSRHLERMRRRLVRWRERLDRTLICLEAEVDESGSYLPAALGAALGRLEAGRARVEELTRTLGSAEEPEYMQISHELREAWVELRVAERELATRRARWRRRAGREVQRPAARHLREELKAQSHLAAVLRQLAAGARTESARAAGTRLIHALRSRGQSLRDRTPASSIHRA